MLWGKSVRGRIIEGGDGAASRTERVGGAQCWREGCKIERERGLGLSRVGLDLLF